MYLGPNAKVRWRILNQSVTNPSHKDAALRWRSRSNGTVPKVPLRVLSAYVEGPERIRSRRIIGRVARAIIQ